MQLSGFKVVMITDGITMTFSMAASIHNAGSMTLFNKDWNYN